MLSSQHLAIATNALTTLLYSGEWTNPNGTQYLRARFYDPATGRFNRLDPFAGNQNDPQSLHKYLYTHGNPIMGIDPSGEATLLELAFVAGKKSGMIAKKVIGTRLVRNSIYEGLFNVFIGAAIRGIWNDSFESAINPVDITADFAGGFVGGLAGGAAGGIGVKFAKFIRRKTPIYAVRQTVVLIAKFGPPIIGAVIGTLIEIYTESKLSGKPVSRDYVLARVVASMLFATGFKYGEPYVEKVAVNLRKYAEKVGGSASAEIDVLLKNIEKNTLKRKPGLVARSREFVNDAALILDMASLTHFMGKFLAYNEIPGAIQLSNVLIDAMGEESINLLYEYFGG